MPKKGCPNWDLNPALPAFGADALPTQISVKTTCFWHYYTFKPVFHIKYINLSVYIIHVIFCLPRSIT